MIVADHGRRQRCRQYGVPRGIDDVRRHGPGEVGVQGKRQQIGVQVVRLDPRQREVAVHPGAAMARRVLADRLDAGGEQAGRQRPRRAAPPTTGSSASARSPMTACAPGWRGRAPVRRRRRSRRRHNRGRSARRSARRHAGRRRGAGEQRAERRRGGMRAPVRRPQAGDAAALLVHHQHGLRRQGSAQCGDQRRQLPRASILRANRITPAGGCARNSAASSADSVGPAMPTMAAFRSRRPSSRPPWRGRARRMRWPGRRRRSRRCARAKGVAVVLDLAEGRLAMAEQVRHALRQPLPFALAAPSDANAASCTSGPFAAARRAPVRRSGSLVRRRRRLFGAACPAGADVATGAGTGTADGAAAAGRAAPAAPALPAAAPACRRWCRRRPTGFLVRAGDLHAARVVRLHPDRADCRPAPPARRRCDGRSASSRRQPTSKHAAQAAGDQRQPLRGRVHAARWRGTR